MLLSNQLEVGVKTSTPGPLVGQGTSSKQNHMAETKEEEGAMAGGSRSGRPGQLISHENECHSVSSPSCHPMTCSLSYPTTGHAALPMDWLGWLLGPWWAALKWELCLPYLCV